MKNKIVTLLRDSPDFIGDQIAAEKIADEIISYQHINQDRLAYLEREVHPTYDNNNCMCGQMSCPVCHG